MKTPLDFQVIITKDEDSVFVATCPAIPGCHTQGKTYEEAEKNIKEAINLCLAVAADDPEYRAGINFSQAATSQFVGISDIQVTRPQFL